MSGSGAAPAIAPAIAVRVARKTREAEGVAGFRLVAADGARLPAFAPGAHIDVALPGGLVRQYSLCNLGEPGDHYEIGVLREAASRGGSLALHEAVHEGALLNISAPRNHFPLDEGATHSLLLAGGIGVTPLLSMAQRLAATGAGFALHCCSRTAARAPYRRRLEGSAFAHKVFFHHDDGPPAQRIDFARTLGSPAPGKHLYVCGPQGFLDAVRATARNLRWADAQVHFEYFSGAARRPASKAASRSSCAARAAWSACPRRSPWWTRWRPRASTFPSRARRACAAPASRACSRATSRTTTSTSRPPSRRPTTSSCPAARGRAQPGWCSISSSS
jgi:vanillate O-demethylase ferredoxin subunit